MQTVALINVILNVAIPCVVLFAKVSVVPPVKADTAVIPAPTANVAVPAVPSEF